MERAVLLAGLCLALTSEASGDRAWSPVPGPVFHRAYPCKNSTDIAVRFEADLPPKYNRSFYLDVNVTIPAHSVIKVTFDAEVRLGLTLKSDDDKISRISFSDGEKFVLRFAEELPGLSVMVKGSHPRLTPHLKSFIVNGTEHCERPDKAFLEEYAANLTTPTNEEYPLKFSVESHSKECGRRRIGTKGPFVDHAGLITNLPVDGTSKVGDWPWHTAIFYARDIKITELYLDGGTLISKRWVLTAFSNVADYTVETLLVKFGKHVLKYVGKEVQLKRVEKRVDAGFVKNGLKNDLALLKTASEVQFTDYVRPACLWHRRQTNPPPRKTLVGTLVGWGQSNDKMLSYNELLQVNLPVVKRNTCVASNSRFKNLLNEKKFCAGYRNQGTAPCNGDSGGAFQVFIPDKQRDDDNGTRSGAWYVRGVLSKITPLGGNPNKCDADQYVVFTDVEPYADWIEMNLDDI